MTTSPKKVSLWRWSAEFLMFKEDKSSELRADGAASSTFFAFENAFYLIIVTVYNFVSYFRGILEVCLLFCANCFVTSL